MNEEQLAVLPEAVRDWDEAKNSDTPEIFWDRIGNIRSKLGTSLHKPGSDAGDEDWNKYVAKAIDASDGRLMPKVNLEDDEQMTNLFTSLGRPAESSGYEFEAIEGADLDEDRQKFIQDIAFKANLTKAQLKSLDKEIRTADMNAKVESDNAFTEGLKELRQEWGLANDERTHAAVKIAKTFFPHLGDKPTLSAVELRAFFSLAKQLGQGNAEFKDQLNNDPTGMDPDEASEKISEIRNNKEHPYNNPRDPGHKAAKRKMRSLYLIKNNLPPE